MKMFFRDFLLWAVVLVTIIHGNPLPGGSSQHVHHRIHIPQKIKTIYHTKIIKVPEHHHHFHEKEKIIIEKEKPKEEHHPVYLHDEEEEEERDWSGFENSNFLKKKRNAHRTLRPTKSKTKKRRIAPRHPYPYHKPKFQS